MRTFPTDSDVEQFKQRARSGQFTAEDLDAFYKNPRLWRQEVSIVAPEDAQTFWQMVWDEMALEIGGRIIVPPVPRLTDKQRKSIENFRMLPVYIQAFDKERYPACFVKPDRQKYLRGGGEHISPKGQWVAFETIKKPQLDDPAGYPDDGLAAALKLKSRFKVSWDDLKGGLLERAARITGFPKNRTRLPTAEEWNFVGNLFNWLREHRGIDLPDLGSTTTFELCENADSLEHRLIVGDFRSGGLACVSYTWNEGRGTNVGFRVLFEL